MDQSQTTEISHLLFYFLKILFQFKTSYKGAIWCVNDPNAHIPTFCKR